MSDRIALRCSLCRNVSYRPVEFVRARFHFMCNHCQQIVNIDPDDVVRALVHHQRDVDGELNALEPAPGTEAEKRGD
jgi:hypothetical protein